MRLNKRTAIRRLIIIVLLIMLSTTQAFAYSEATLLRKEMENSSVMKLQNDLHGLGFLTVNPTGYYGSLTEAAVMNFQRQYGLTSDGIAGGKTIAQLKQVLQGDDTTMPIVTRGSTTRTPSKGDIELRPWFGDIEHFFARGDVASIVDVATGLVFKAERTYGTNHADMETSSQEDTEILKQIAGGEWNWVRRPIIVEIHGVRLAASMTARPHAGLDRMPALQTVSNRSGGFGKGMNLDQIKGNGMDGHFDIHFLKSKTHGSNSIDADHQKALQKAAKASL